MSLQPSKVLFVALTAAALLASITDDAEACKRRRNRDQTSPTAVSAYEWGLVKFNGDSSEVATSGFDARVPSGSRFNLGGEEIRAYEQITVDKPLIYLIPEDNFRYGTTFDVTVDVVGGSLREVWPTPDGGGQPSFSGDFRWENVDITRSDVCGEITYPSVEHPACTSLDGGVCETAELSQYLNAGDSCLVSGGVHSRVLLYNAWLRWTPPIELSTVERDGESAVTVRNTLDTTLPFVVVRDGQQYYLFEGLAAGQTASTAGLSPRFYAGETEEAWLGSVQQYLKLQGLADLVVADFMAAWQPDVLGPARDWQAFGFYPESYISQSLQVSIDPQPDNFHRVFAFSVEAATAE